MFVQDIKLSTFRIPGHVFFISFIEAECPPSFH
jgi:hypothetical protein